MTPRNVTGERGFLRAAHAVAALTARPDRWIEDVERRLDSYGPDNAPRELDVFVRELVEEALDLGGWAVLAAQQTDSPEVRNALLRVAALGAAAHDLLSSGASG